MLPAFNYILIEPMHKIDSFVTQLEKEWVFLFWRGNQWWYFHVHSSKSIPPNRQLSDYYVATP